MRASANDRDGILKRANHQIVCHESNVNHIGLTYGQCQRSHRQMVCWQVKLRVSLKLHAVSVTPSHCSFRCSLTWRCIAINAASAAFSFRRLRNLGKECKATWGASQESACRLPSRSIASRATWSRAKDSPRSFASRLPATYPVRICVVRVVSLSINAKCTSTRQASFASTRFAHDSS